VNSPFPGFFFSSQSLEGQGIAATGTGSNVGTLPISQYLLILKIGVKQFAIAQAAKSLRRNGRDLVPGQMPRQAPRQAFVENLRVSDNLTLAHGSTLLANPVPHNPEFSGAQRQP